MIPGLRQPERHFVTRTGWLRAAVLGANDGILSTASLILGVAAGSGTRASILVAGVSGLVAGAMSMAAGEFVSVSSQADSEQADVGREREELDRDESGELHELTAIYRKRGLDQDLASKVARQLMEHDAIGAHTRDELGISEATSARPVQAALTSAASFSVGATLPLLMVILTPANLLVVAVVVASMALLALLGAIGARTGGSSMWKATVRVAVWGGLAMAVTSGIGAVFGNAM